MKRTRTEPTLRGARRRRHLELRRGARTLDDLRSPLATVQLPSPERTDHGRVRVLIVDDHEVVRQCASRIVSDQTWCSWT
jgi:hypothetical protein